MCKCAVECVRECVSVVVSSAETVLCLLNEKVCFVIIVCTDTLVREN
jgi:hypothetical protein